MTINSIPQVFYKNKITEVLDEMRDSYGKLTSRGYIYGILTIDQDAKIIAVDTRFDRQLNYWDLSSIGAALYGVARQGRDFFSASTLNRATIIYNDLQLFVRSIGPVFISERGGMREVLIVILADKVVNIGVILLQLTKYASAIRTEIERNNSIKKTLIMTEDELKAHIRELKKEIFGDKISTIS